MSMRSRSLALLFAVLAASACTGGSEQPAQPAGHAEPQVCARGSVPAASKYQGLTLPAAEAQAREAGLTVRVVGEDGACLLPTHEDADASRLNLFLDDGKVATASIG